MRRIGLLGALSLALGGWAQQAQAEPGEWTGTVYVAQISGERTWQKLMADPLFSDYVRSWLLVGALSRTWSAPPGARSRWEGEVNLAWHFGRQHLWELNVAPVVARWQRFPWDRRVATSAAFGIGLSLASEVPPVEVELETASDRMMVFWTAEISAAPPRARWAAVLRVHHRSKGFGLFGDEGGMNALGFGVRWQL